MKRNENYAKSIKNWLTVISSTSFLVNTIQVIDIESIFMYAFTYLSSIGLAFYNLKPSTEKSEKRRRRMIEASIGSVAAILISFTLGKTNELVYSIMLYLIKGFYIFFAFFAVICTFYDDSEMTTEEEKDISKATRERMNEKDYKEKYKTRNKRISENKKTRKFLLKKKESNKEDIK